MLTDRYGLPLSTTVEAACDAYNIAVNHLLSANAGVDTALHQALTADPEFALAHVALARNLQLSNRGGEARAVIANAQKLADDLGLTRRERQHIHLFALLLNGQPAAALSAIREHMSEFPLDALALSPTTSVFGLIGFSGRIDREPELVALLEPLRSVYGDDWWLQTVLGFAYVENGQVLIGRQCLERALELFPRNAHAAHMYVHALYESDDALASRDYLMNWLQDYPPEGQLHCHLYWHLALCELSLGRPQQMWQIYNEKLAPGVSQSPPINIFTDGSALLWRAELAGEPHQQALWIAQRNYAEQQFPKPGIFIDMHYALALAACNDNAALEHYLAELTSAEQDGTGLAGPVPAAVGKAAEAFVKQRWNRVAELLEPVMDQIVRIGGSRAQRDLVINTLLAAYINSNRNTAAKHLLAQRPLAPDTVQPFNCDSLKT